MYITLKEKQIVNFWNNVDFDGPKPPPNDVWELDTNCWLWNGKVEKTGYGTVHLSNNGRAWTGRVHRIAWALVGGRLFEGIDVCHKCDVRNCVNPDHLFLDTGTGNVADMCKKGRQCKGEKASEVQRRPDVEAKRNAVLNRPEVKAKKSASLKRIWATQEHREKMATSMRAVRQTSSYRERHASATPKGEKNASAN
jgi:hypothetical protein